MWGRPAGRPAADLIFCPYADLVTTRCACKKTFLANLRDDKQIDHFKIILRLNKAKKKSRETECDVKNDSKYQNEGDF